VLPPSTNRRYMDMENLKNNNNNNTKEPDNLIKSQPATIRSFFYIKFLVLEDFLLC